jgi:hypothetical protein
MIRQLVQERNEAWNERDLLRQRVEELEEYNINLHEEFTRSTTGLACMLLQTPPVWTSIRTRMSLQLHLPTTMTSLLMVATVMSPTPTMAPEE